MTSTLTWALVIVLTINMALFLGQTAVYNLSLEDGLSSDTFYTCKGNIYGQIEQSGCSGSTYVLNDSNPSAYLPSVEQTVSADIGAIFTDIFSGIKNWFIDDLGLGYLTAILSAPSNVLKLLGLPQEISFILGAFWYALTLFLIGAFFFGRDV